MSFLIKSQNLNERYAHDDRVLLEDRQNYRSGKEYDIFLSYNHKDRVDAIIIYKRLKSQGYTVYADFIDNNFPIVANVDTAKLLTNKIKCCKALIYIHSTNASNSKWCPWEVGLSSGVNDFNVYILPLLDKEGDKYNNQEYLQLYEVIEEGPVTKKLRVHLKNNRWKDIINL